MDGSSQNNQSLTPVKLRYGSFSMRLQLLLHLRHQNYWTIIWMIRVIRYSNRFNSIAYPSEVKVWFTFNASPIETAPLAPISVFHNLRYRSCQSNQNQNINHTHIIEVKVWLSFNPSPISIAPSSPRFLWVIRGINEN